MLISISVRKTHNHTANANRNRYIHTHNGFYIPVRGTHEHNSESINKKKHSNFTNIIDFGQHTYRYFADPSIQPKTLLGSGIATVNIVASLSVRKHFTACVCVCVFCLMCLCRKTFSLLSKMYAFEMTTTRSGENLWHHQLSNCAV